MKVNTAIKKLIWGLTFGGVLALGLNACKNPVSDSIELIIDADYVVPVASIQVVDAKTLELITTDITVVKLGQDADALYNSSAEGQLSAIEGIIDISTLKEQQPGNGQALTFAIQISAEGYLTTMKYFNSYEEFSVSSVRMIKLDAPPTGVTVTQTTIDMGGTSGPSTAISFGTPAGNGTDDRVQVTIPAGTQFFAEDNEQLTGEMDVTLAYFSNQQSSSLEAFPGGFNVVSAVDASGTPLNPGNFQSGGFMAIEIRSKRKKVKDIPSGMSIDMDINSNTINPTTGNPIQAGEQIPLWSFSDGSETWTAEGNVNISQSGNKLMTNFAITHLSYYNLDYFTSAGCTETTISFNTDIDYTETYQVKLVDASTGAQVFSDMIALTNGASITFANAPGMNVIMKVYSFDGSELIDETLPFDMCNTGSIDLTLSQSNAVPLIVSGSLSSYCQGSIKLFPPAMTYIRESGSSQWQFFGKFASNEFQTQKPIYLGKVYDLMIVSFGTSYTAENIAVIEGSGEHTFQGTNTTISINVDASSNTATFNMNDIEIPQEICDQLTGG